MLRRKKYPVVVLHGWKVEADRYRKLKDELEIQGYQVYVPDMPGDQVGPNPKKALTLDNYVSYICNFLSQKKIKECIIIGHSFGGRVGIKLAAYYPKVVKKLILTGVPGFRTQSLLKIKFFEIISKIGKAMIKKNQQLQKILYRLAGTRDYLLSKGVERKTFRNIINEDLAKPMRKIICPTLLIWGENDRMVPTKIAKKMRKEISSSKFTIVANAVHSLPYSRPETFIRKSGL